MIQNNITVATAVKKRLKARAKEDTGDEQGWLRLLTPADDATPTTTCPTPAESLVVFLGLNSVGSCSADSCILLKDSQTEGPSGNLLSVTRKRNSLMVEGVVFDESGKVVVALDQGRPHVNKNIAFGWNRPDDHTLEVTDQRNRVVLKIRFMNRTTVFVEGLFYTSHGNSLSIEDTRLVMRGQHGGHLIFEHSCTTNTKVAYSF